MKNKSTIKYRVCVSYVDDSYWDDGSRWTSKTFKFDKRQESIDFAKECISKGCTLPGQNGEVRTRPTKEDIKIYRDSSVEIDF